MLWNEQVACTQRNTSTRKEQPAREGNSVVLFRGSSGESPARVPFGVCSRGQRCCAGGRRSASARLTQQRTSSLRARRAQCGRRSHGAPSAATCGQKQMYICMLF